VKSELKRVSRAQLRREMIPKLVDAAVVGDVDELIESLLNESPVRRWPKSARCELMRTIGRLVPNAQIPDMLDTASGLEISRREARREVRLALAIRKIYDCAMVQAERRAARLRKIVEDERSGPPIVGAE
jgi:hypothetical protein